jgi:hypothetical protein
MVSLGLDAQHEAKGIADCDHGSDRSASDAALEFGDGPPIHADQVCEILLRDPERLTSTAEILAEFVGVHSPSLMG